MENDGKTKRKTQDERSRETREKLKQAAKEAILEEGFHAASTPQIAKSAGVSRGALYHQYPDKEALLVDLVREMQADLVGKIEVIANAQTDAFSALKEGTKAYIRLASDPAYHRIVMIEAPAVMGRVEFRALDGAATVASLQEGIMAIRPMEAEAARIMAHLLAASIDEAVFLTVEGTGDPNEIWTGLDEMMTRLFMV